MWRPVSIVKELLFSKECFACFFRFKHQNSLDSSENSRCCQKIMRLAILCTIRQRCSFPFQMAVRVTPVVDSVQFWTCYSCYAIVDSVWIKLCLWGALRKWPDKVWAKFCHQILCKAWRIRYCDLWMVTKGLWKTFPIQATSVQMAQVLFRKPRTSGKRTSCGKTFNLKKRTTIWKEWGLLWVQIVDWLWEWSAVS